MAEGYQCHIIINNRTDQHLVYDKADQPWGKFKDDGHPVQDIPPKTEVKAFAAQGTPFTPAGCEGTVVYRFQDDANVKISIYYEIPTTKPDNRVEVNSSNTDVATELKGFSGKGAVESCTIKIVDGR